MTSSEMPTRIAMPMPFASGASATRATIESVSGDNLNYVDGFPGKYSLPASDGGKYVSRGEMNAIGNMASNDLHYFKCGGLNTYDEAFCAAVGGYPKGAVLDYIVGYKLYKVISLVDGNMIDFTASGVDGVNWQYLNQDTIDPEQPQTKMFSFKYSGNSYGSIGIFKCEKDSHTFLIENNLTSSTTGSQSTSAVIKSGDFELYAALGFCFAIADLGIDGTSIPGGPTMSVDYNGTTGAFSVKEETSNGWMNLYGRIYIMALGLKAGNADINVYSYDYPVDKITGFIKDHYYAVSAFGTFEDYSFVGQEQSSASTVTASLQKTSYTVNGNLTIYY